MGRILRVGLMVLLVAAAGVGNVWGEEVWVTSENWQYAKIGTTNTCRIKPGGSGTIEGIVKIPNEVGSLTVVEIAEGAFFYCSKLTGVKFPSGLITIGSNAFFGCSNLTGVEFPSGVQTIGNSAFYDCKGLKEVRISGSVRKIEALAFSGCSGLKEFKVDEKNASYSQDGGVLFTKDRDTLVSYPGGRKGAYEIPGIVTGISVGAFAGCEGLTAVTIPSSVKTIEEFTFSGCTGLTAVTIPDGVTRIGWGAFITCSRLKGVVIPSSVKTIGDDAFYGCEGLTEMKIPGGVTKIGQLAFANCSKLNKVYWFTDANCNVGDDAFQEIASAATLYVRQGEMEKIKDKPWCKNIFTIEEGFVVTFKDGEGNKLGEQLVKPNGTATAPTAPTRKGYTLVEWQLDGAKYDFSTLVTKDITLVAVWKKKEESAPSTPKDPKDPKDPKTAVESVQLAGVRAVRNPVGAGLELEGMERAARVEVYSVVGARVYAEALRGEPRVVIDARGWASGVYVVKVEASDGAKTLRVVK